MELNACMHVCLCAFGLVLDMYVRDLQVSFQKEQSHSRERGDI